MHSRAGAGAFNQFCSIFFSDLARRLISMNRVKTASLRNKRQRGWLRVPERGMISA